MRIAHLQTLGPEATVQAAARLVEGFADHWPRAYPDAESAAGTAPECLDRRRICRTAVDRADHALGWSAAEPIYRGNVWELNVLVVRPARQRHGSEASSCPTWNSR